MRNIILGTDWWTDCDDVVALRVLCRSHKAGKINLLGAVINACMEYSAASLNGFAESEGYLDMPIGVDKGQTHFSGNPPYQKGLAPLSQRIKSNDDVDEGVRVYRKLLAQAEGDVEMLEIGFLHTLVALFKSGPDDISEKSGMELVQEKVKKFWIMAGKWDVPEGHEYNFYRSPVAAREFCELAPAPVTFLGYEVGDTVISGGELQKDDILYKALCDHNSPNGRSSWDPLTALMAVIGDEEKAGYKTVSGKARVDETTGNNYFEEGDGPHKYVVKIHPDSYYQKMLNDYIK